MGQPELIIIRHGETVWNAQRRIQGHLNSELSETGEAQARAMGEVLRAHVDVQDYRVITSPLGRARQTAELMGLEGASDDRLREIYVGDWQGLTMDEAMAMTPELAKWLDENAYSWWFRAPAGETLEAFRARIWDFLNDCHEPTIIVAHGVWSRVTRAMVLGLDDEGMCALPGGQGDIYHIKHGKHYRLGLYGAEETEI